MSVAVTELTKDEKEIILKDHPSLGSVKHSEGACKRCCFFPRNRCQNGDQCEFCHYEHEKRTHRKRKSKSARNRDSLEINMDAINGDAPSSSGTSPTSAEMFMPTPTTTSPTGSDQRLLCTQPTQGSHATRAVPVYTNANTRTYRQQKHQSPWPRGYHQQVNHMEHQQVQYIDNQQEQYLLDPNTPAYLPELCANQYPQDGFIWHDDPPSEQIWQDQTCMQDPSWQVQGCGWSAGHDAQWMGPPGFHQCQQTQEWENQQWQAQANEAYYSNSWDEQQMPAAAMQTTMQGNQWGTPATNGMPEYIPAITSPALPAGVAAAQDSKPPPLVPSTQHNIVHLPPGVEKIKDCMPPPFAPQ